jgi:hypothetical protein
MAPAKPTVLNTRTNASKTAIVTFFISVDLLWGVERTLYEKDIQHYGLDESPPATGS